MLFPLPRPPPTSRCRSPRKLTSSHHRTNTSDGGPMRNFFLGIAVVVTCETAMATFSSQVSNHQYFSPQACSDDSYTCANLYQQCLWEHPGTDCETPYVECLNGQPGSRRQQSVVVSFQPISGEYCARYSVPVYWWEFRLFRTWQGIDDVYVLESRFCPARNTWTEVVVESWRLTWTCEFKASQFNCDNDPNFITIDDYCGEGEPLSTVSCREFR